MLGRDFHVTVVTGHNAAFQYSYMVLFDMWNGQPSILGVGFRFVVKDTLCVHVCTVTHLNTSTVRFIRTVVHSKLTRLIVRLLNAYLNYSH